VLVLDELQRVLAQCRPNAAKGIYQKLIFDEKVRVSTNIF